MPSLLDARSRLALRLEAAGIPDAALEAELLVRHVTGLDRSALFRDGDRALAEEEQGALERFAQRRLAREPLAYILGEREFYGLTFVVDPRVLIPRPETETLVDLALAWAHHRSSDGAGLTIADIGTGSGCIAISLGVDLPRARVIATDLSANALDVARLNAARHHVLERIALRQGDLLEPLDERVDAIVANLPYVAEDEAADLAPEIREHEPSMALFAGADGLALLSRLVAAAPGYLKTSGGVFLEISPSQAEPLRQLARQVFPRGRIAVHRDLGGLLRVIVIDA